MSDNLANTFEAARSGDNKKIKDVLRKGSFINAVNSDWETALHVAWYNSFLLTLLTYSVRTDTLTS
jgi:hypothetical protein